MFAVVKPASCKASAIGRIMRQLRLSPCSNTTQSVLSAIDVTWVRGWLAQDAIRLAESRSAAAVLR